MITDLAAREAFHVLVLREMCQRLNDSGFVLKGGVNLRLYFGSVRYSEDMDLDGDPSKRQELTRILPQVLRSNDFEERLRGLDIRGLLWSGRAAKDGDFTLRYKLRIVTRAGLELSTKIEVSFRDQASDDAWAAEPADEHVVRPYLRNADADLRVPHYLLTAAVRQKIGALGSRSIVQARDVFDLHILTRGGASLVEFTKLRSGLAAELLDEALARVWAIEYGQFADQVLHFLDEPNRAEYGSADKWDSIRLETAHFIETARYSE